MKKITAIIGSPNNDTSNTLALISDFLANIQEYDSNIEYEIITLGNKNIHSCNGCWACMKIGKCVINDDLQEIQEKLLTSDLMVFGSPVYVHQISGQMKTFIDRIFIWVHIMKLIGKPAITVVTTAQTGTKPVEKYLVKVLKLLGAIPVAHLNAIAYQPGNFPKRDEYNRKYQNTVKKIVKIINGQKRLVPSIMNHIYFLAHQITYRKLPQHLPFEHNYWKNKKWFGKTYTGAWKSERNTLNK